MRRRAALGAILLCVVIALAGAILIVRMTASAVNETATVQAAEAPEIARLYLAADGTLAKAAPAIVRRVSRDGLRVMLFDDSNGMVYTTGGTHRLRPRIPLPGPDGFGPAPGPRLAGPDGDGPAGSVDGPAPMFGQSPPGGAMHSDWLGIAVAALAGERSRIVPIAGGRIVIFPEPDSMLALLRTVLLALAFVCICSGTVLWFYVRSVRRAALRPLHETTVALQQLAERDFTPRTIMAGGGGAYDALARAYNAAVEAVSSSFAERRAAEIEMQRFIADAGHELRTPLTIVMGYLDIIDGGALADPSVAGRITSGMRTEAMRMRKLVEKLIILARMETPSDADARTNLDVVSLVARVIESLEPLTAQPIVVAGLSFAHVFANEDDVADALTNIVENGIKYAPHATISISVERREERVVIAIADRGPGMSTDEQRNAFERFYRGERRGEVSGSGLGLAIAKRAIERAGGTIHLTSIAGRGTTFTIELPERPIAVDDSRPVQLTRR